MKGFCTLSISIMISDPPIVDDYSQGEISYKNLI
jgi:hypothetical protein